MWGVLVPGVSRFQGCLVGTSQQKQVPKTQLMERNTQGDPPVQEQFSAIRFSPGIYAVGALVFAAEGKSRKLRHHMQEVENPTPAHSQGPGKLGSH